MDSKFKQRLTGAVILVLLAVLLVPEMLTGPKSVAPGPTSSAPSSTQGEGAPLRSYDIDLSETGAGAAPASATASPATPGGAARGTATPPPVSAASRTAERAPTSGSRTAGAGDASRGVEDDDSSASGPAPAMRGFAVQVGSFASRASADRLAADLDRRRFETFVSPVRSAGRQLFRVRVGPVADRAAAQALASRLKATGQVGSVVALP